MSETLDGITILDLSHGMEGSIATMTLSDFGATVVKIEPPEGDPYRDSPSSLLWNRGKKSAVLNILSKEDQLEFKKLSRSTDVLVESNKPGFMDSLGIGYDDLKKENPALIYCSITGFGLKGPYAMYKDYEGIVRPRAEGLCILRGYPVGKAPISHQ